MRKAAMIALIALGAVTLAGCGTTVATVAQDVGALVTGGTVAQSAPTAIADAEKALTIAHLAYQGAGSSLIDAANSGTLHGTAATSAQALYDKAGDALDVADKADDAANAAGIMAAVSNANAALTSANALIHPPPSAPAAPASFLPAT